MKVAKTYQTQLEDTEYFSGIPREGMRSCEIFLPYVETTRAHYLQREGWEVGDDVEDKDVWVGWQVSSRKWICCSCRS